MKNLILTLFLATVLMSCTDDEIPVLCQNSIEAMLINREDSAWTCGGHYHFATDWDTLHIKYNDVLRDFFIATQFDENDYPMEVRIIAKNLEETDECHGALMELECIAPKDWYVALK